MTNNAGGLHLSNPVINWPSALHSAGPGVVAKLFWTEGIGEVRSSNPLAIPIRRHWVDHQDPLIFAEDKFAAARSLFNQFIDGTFMSWAALWGGYGNMFPPGLVEELNEYASHTNDPTQLAEKVEWARAAAIVWKQEFRTIPDLQNVRLILGNIAIGNDWGPFNLEIGKICRDWDAVYGYHPYIPMRNKVVAADEWKYYSGRWAALDDWLTKNGIFIDYAFTEGGPIGYEPNASGGIGPLNPLGGWRHPDVADGDLGAVKASIEYWWENAAKTRAYAEGRLIGGPVLFDSGWSPTWEWFQYQDGSLQEIAQWMGTYELPAPSWDGGPPPPQPPPPGIVPPELAEAVWFESINRQTISLNPDAALQKAIFADGYVPVGSEFWFSDGSGSFACMPAEHLAGGERRVYMARVPVWSLVWYITENDF